MTVTFTQFTGDFPEFVSVAQTQFDFWSDVAYAMLNPNRWPSAVSATTGLTLLDRGAELFIAHNLALGERAQAEATKGAPPGTSQGPIASKSVGRASVSYDTSSGLNPDDAQWNDTIYGKRFAQMLRITTAGPIQAGIGCVGLDDLNGPAWAGPWPYPEPGGTGFGS